LTFSKHTPYPDGYAYSHLRNKHLRTLTCDSKKQLLRGPVHHTRNNPYLSLHLLLLTSILLESLSRPLRARDSSPMLAVMNLASEMMAATSSRPSFLIFQFLSPILDTSSEEILSLREGEREINQYKTQHRLLLFHFTAA